MNPPLDYPTENNVQQMDAVQSELTLAMVLDQHASEQPITNQMLEQACRRIDTAHELTTGTQDDAVDSGITRLLKAFR